MKNGALKIITRKKKIPVSFSLVVLILFFKFVAPVVAVDSSERFSVIMPADSSMVEGDLISFVIKVNKSNADTIKITRNKTEIASFTHLGSLSRGKDYLCKVVSLEFGPNEFVIDALEKGGIVETKKLTVFYRSDISKRFSINPPEFRRNPFHKEDREVGCMKCHRTDVSEEDMKPAKPEGSLCYPCHKMITAYRNVHGPAARWACLTCHDKNTRPVKYTTVKPDRDLCFTCHKEKKEEWKSKKYVHGPTATGKCTICHNPHASDNEFWLRKPTWDLCTGCHEDRASGSHVIVGFGSGTHPTRGRPDPSRYGKELSCASCHNPHASNAKSLFINDADDLYDLCKVCHKNK